MAVAGMSAVQYARQPGDKTLIPGTKTGAKFLASSHFSIAQENHVNQDAMRSIFTKDYVPWEILSKPPAAKPPKLSEVIQKDDRYFNEKASETKQAYEYRSLPKPELKDARGKLSTTNFKMDRDPRLNSFQTTHNQDYTPKQGSAVARGQPTQNPMQSFIPQGDREKAPDPISDYRDRYRRHEVTKPEKANSMHQGGHPTILGDARQHHFNTTHTATYKGFSVPKVKQCVPLMGSHIPQGDVDKEVTMQTIHQASFPAHDMSTLQPYDKNEVMGKLQETNFIQGDGHGRWNDYLSTMADSYKPVLGDNTRSAPGRHRNHSDFPQMDVDPHRNAERANTTTNRFYHGNPPPTEKPRIVSGAQKRTESQVWFGEPTLGDKYYDTTTDSTFRPFTMPYKPHQPRQSDRPAVPLDYYDNEQNNTTYRTHFLNTKQGKMIPDPRAIQTLKESHIRPPLGGQRQFCTEHLDQYTPKQTRRSAIDPGRLQRSHVPLGTLPM